MINIDPAFRRITYDDLEKIMHWRMLPEVTRYMYTDPVLTMKDQERWFETIQNSDRDMYWMIELYTGKEIGVINLNHIDPYNKHCSWGYYIGELDERDKGYASILECNIYDYVFDHLKLNKLWGEVLGYNEKVLSIHQKFGSKIEGVLKEHIYKNGVFHDVVRIAILKREWHAIRHQFTYPKIEIESVR